MLSEDLARQILELRLRAIRGRKPGPNLKQLAIGEAVLSAVTDARGVWEARRIAIRLVDEELERLRTAPKVRADDLERLLKDQQFDAMSDNIIWYLVRPLNDRRAALLVAIIDPFSLDDVQRPALVRIAPPGFEDFEERSDLTIAVDLAVLGRPGDHAPAL